MTDQANPTADAHSFGMTIKEAGSSRFTAAEPAAVANASGILSTAKSRSGGALSREPGAADIVEVDGMTMPLATAAQFGFVKQTEDGRFVDIEADALAKLLEPANKEEAEPDVSNAFDFAADEATSIADASALIQSAGGNVAHTIGQFLANPDGVPESYLAAARSKGLSDADAQAQVRAVAETVDAAVARYVISQGVSEEQLNDFWSYVKATVPRSQYAGAIAQALYVGDAKPFAKYVANFKTAKGSGRGAARNVETAKIGAREVDTVNVPGVGRVSVEAARRAGLV